VKYIIQNLEGHPLVRPEVLDISVAADTNSLSLEICVRYYDDRAKPPMSNPVVCVTADGEVIRTHGDFHRLRGWVEEMVLL
jgi:hypothetical protein